MNLLSRFLRYVAIDTQSDPASGLVPSTPGQTAMLELLAGELCEMGATEVRLEAGGAPLTATIPATRGNESEPVVGLIAHVDTSPDAPGRGVKPVIAKRDGDTIITSDGTTLLGADDKAGVAIIMTVAERLLGSECCERKTGETGNGEAAGRGKAAGHGKVRLAFTTDEEVGRGVDRFDVEGFGADMAYTVDGGEEGSLEYENFNAARAVVTIEGRNAHPGDAEGKMVNALRVAMELDATLPADERPETTRDRQGFYHLTRLEGEVAKAEMEYLVRDHDRERFEARKARIVEAAAALDEKYGPKGRPKGRAVVEAKVEDQYHNMIEVLEKHPEAVERARRAMVAAGVTPIEKPIRGGTDGARLSFAGLPCPNLFTGGRNFHSLDENVSLKAMERAVEVVLEIVRGNRTAADAPTQVATDAPTHAPAQMPHL